MCPCNETSHCVVYDPIISARVMRYQGAAACCYVMTNVPDDSRTRNKHSNKKLCSQSYKHILS